MVFFFLVCVDVEGTLLKNGAPWLDIFLKVSVPEMLLKVIQKDLKNHQAWEKCSIHKPFLHPLSCPLTGAGEGRLLFGVSICGAMGIEITITAVLLLV